MYLSPISDRATSSFINSTVVFARVSMLYFNLGLCAVFNSSGSVPPRPCGSWLSTSRPVALHVVPVLDFASDFVDLGRFRR